MHFFLGFYFVRIPTEQTFPFVSDGIPLLADKIFLGTWASNKSFGRSLRTWPTVSEHYLQWLDRVQAAYRDLWKEVDIFDAIQLSRNAYQADHLLLA